MVIHNPTIEDNRPIQPMKKNSYTDHLNDNDYYMDDYGAFEAKVNSETEGMRDVVDHYQSFMTLPNFGPDQEKDPKGNSLCGSTNNNPAAKDSIKEKMAQLKKQVVDQVGEENYSQAYNFLKKHRRLGTSEENVTCSL